MKFLPSIIFTVTPQPRELRLTCPIRYSEEIRRTDTGPTPEWADGGTTVNDRDPSAVRRSNGTGSIVITLLTATEGQK